MNIVVPKPTSTVRVEDRHELAIYTYNTSTATRLTPAIEPWMQLQWQVLYN